MTRRPRRFAVLTVVALIGVLSSLAPNSFASPAPSVDPAMVPPDGPPGPEQPMRQSHLCASVIAADEPAISEPAPGFAMLNIASAWRFSTGNGVSVALIDTGVTPNPRLPVVPGGDYIAGGDGLTDCDAHGTIAASVIAAAPQGIPAPRPMPPRPGAAAESAAVPRLTPGPPDGVVGVAPHASILSIRQSSRAYEPQDPGAGDGAERRKAGSIATLARAIVHAANLGARVINIGVAACVSHAEALDQRSLGAAVWYAATVKDSVIVAAAGNDGEDGCTKNPSFDPLDLVDRRDWHQVVTVSSPSWFADYVLSVGAVGPAGSSTGASLAGPWVGVAAPGESIIGLSPRDGAAVNAYSPVRPGEPGVPFRGTSFAAAYVSGVAALVRAKYPDLSAHQIIHRLQQTAHNPARGVDNQVGYGVIDPVAALTFDVEPGDRVAPLSIGEALRVDAAPEPTDNRARTFAVSFSGAMAAGVLFGAVLARARRAR